jgi:hypothetical protein
MCWLQERLGASSDNPMKFHTKSGSFRLQLLLLSPESQSCERELGSATSMIGLF